MHTKKLSIMVIRAGNLNDSIIFVDTYSFLLVWYPQ